MYAFNKKWYSYSHTSMKKLLIGAFVLFVLVTGGVTLSRAQYGEVLGEQAQVNTTRPVKPDPRTNPTDPRKMAPRLPVQPIQIGTQTLEMEEKELRVKEIEMQQNTQKNWTEYQKMKEEEIAQKRKEMQEKKKELTEQRKVCELQAKQAQQERLLARKELAKECTYRKFESQIDPKVDATAYAEERKAFQESEVARMKDCKLSLRQFDLETRKKLLEIKQSCYTTERTVLGLYTETAWDQQPEIIEAVPYAQ